MELRNYDVVKRVIMTTKSIALFKKLGQITMEVATDANKVVIRKAVEGLWDVKVDRVRVMNRAGKNKMFARKRFTTSATKKAIITLKQGYQIELPGQFESIGDATAQTPAGGN